jgi:putative FmdB family regulatory protein
MPIYAYRCESCGHAKDVIQKFSDAPLTVCPECNADAFRKQLTAPAFQLKGSGWYVTDFRDQGGKGKAAKPDEAKAGDSAPAAGGSNAPAETAAAARSESSASIGTSGSTSGSSAASSTSGPASTPPAST